MRFAGQYDGTAAEPYFQIASATLIIAISLWMLRRTWRERLRARLAVRRQARGHHLGLAHTHRDAHERAHEDEIRSRFTAGNVTTAQIAMFGLSGGLMPCSAAIAVLLLYLQVNRVWLGLTLVLCFSIGLAITLSTAGVIAAIGIGQAARRWPGLGAVSQRAPYFSGIVMIGVGAYLGWQGWISVPRAW
jgi:nickel/cobalt exporter